MSLPASERNIHATAIVVGTTGLLFVGPSGSGKSSRAFACLAQARTEGFFSALVSDDRVLVSAIGGVLVASAPSSIAGRLELRGTGIVSVGHLSRAVLHIAVLAGVPVGTGRLPEKDERFTLEGLGDLPAARFLEGGIEPLATLRALYPERFQV